MLNFIDSHVIGGKLTIIGGRLSTTKQRTNKLSTFDEASQTWISYYPDMLSIRSKPGVVTHGEYVIVASGAGEDIELMHDDIEILKWPENSRKVSAKLPAPMYDILLTVSDGYIIILGNFQLLTNVYTRCWFLTS